MWRLDRGEQGFADGSSTEQGLADGSSGPLAMAAPETHPLIPVGDDRILYLELPREPLGPKTAEKMPGLYPLLVDAITRAKTPGEGEQPARCVTSYKQIDGEQAQKVVREAFALEEVARLMEGPNAYAYEELEARVAALTDEEAAMITFQWQQLGCRNAQVAHYGEVLSAVLGCNNNPVLLGADQQAKAALFYLIKYVTKDSVALHDALALLHDVKEHVDKWPSKAEGPDREERYLSQRYLNQCNKEFSCTQAAGGALQHKAHHSSEEFVYVSMDQLASLGQRLAEREETHGAAAMQALHDTHVDIFAGCGDGDADADTSDEDDDDDDDEGMNLEK